MSTETLFTKENLDMYLKELAKEFRKRGKGVCAELILVGGASVIVNYAFRASSYDIDAAYEFPTIMKECIHAVADKFSLPNGWLNDDFKRTSSFTPKIVQYSERYKTFYNVLHVRTVRAEYLVAMKLASGRQYKKDLSDIAGIIAEQMAIGCPLTLEKIHQAVCNLYGNWSCISDYAKTLLNEILTCKDLQTLFIELSETEASAKETLQEIVQKYPAMVTKDNVDEVVAAAMEKRKKK